ncbi:SWPV1-190 [Shearwaterpox virus]|uniref:SWPV1-190 n=1 Tax=Shearwaterpox virus TaxID=1974596 RepID=A0A1V0S812_CNPV|nr:SWPV1-190 [Shearwaterpox virus]
MNNQEDPPTNKDKNIAYDIFFGTIIFMLITAILLKIFSLNVGTLLNIIILGYMIKLLIIVISVYLSITVY